MGILNSLSQRDLGTGRDTKIRIEASGKMSDAEIAAAWSEMQNLTQMKIKRNGRNTNPKQRLTRCVLRDRKEPQRIRNTPDADTRSQIRSRNKQAQRGTERIWYKRDQISSGIINKGHGMKPLRRCITSRSWCRRTAGRQWPQGGPGPHQELPVSLRHASAIKMKSVVDADYEMVMKRNRVQWSVIRDQWRITDHGLRMIMDHVWKGADNRTQITRMLRFTRF